jgi:hypothetical protein
VNIPDEVGGKKLTQEQITDLESGKKIYVEGAVSAKTDRKYNVHLQVSAEKWGLNYEFDKSRVTSLGNKDLTEQQIKDYNELDKTIFMKDMEGRTGEKYSRFVTKDCNGNPMYTNYNHQTGEVYIPKVIYGVELDKSEMKMLRNGSEIFLDKMYNNKGEEFSKFVKIDPYSGRILTADKASGFNERPVYQIPQEYFGHKFTAEERKLLQDGESIHVANMKGFDGEKFESWLTFNQRFGHLSPSQEKPESQKKTESQTSAQTAATDKQQKPETPKSETAQTTKKEEKAQVQETGKQDKKSGLSKKVKV